VSTARSYPNLFSPWQLRHSRISNRVVFGPVCPTWVRSAHEGIFTDQAVAYYEERARTGLGARPDRHRGRAFVAR
jgi:2,4-dienoyl-CoA reductase-like NADH-dependent reductase (Old Yellow Enzyme family)